MPIEIRMAQTQSDADAIFRLRYEVYVEELKRSQRYADHAERTVAEPLDRTGNLFCAFENGRVVGTVRTNYASKCDLGEYEELYAMASASAGQHPQSTSITTKLLVSAEHRNSSLGYQLAVATYQTALNDGIEYDFVDVYPARIPFFERLGYRIHRPAVSHAEYGAVVVMSLAIRDEFHFRKVGSPFLAYLTRPARHVA
jgi:GNAT superfamily N-acetyltransferase